MARNQIERVKRINSKIGKLYQKSLGSDELSKEIVNRSYVDNAGTIWFKPKGDKGQYLVPRRIILSDGNYSKDKNSKSALDQFEELVGKLPKPSVGPTTSRKGPTSINNLLKRHKSQLQPK